MYGKRERDNEYTARLSDFIKNTYGISAAGMTPAKRGYYGETWRAGGYFIKLDYSYHKGIYRGSFPVMEHICANGVECISKPVKTLQGALCADFDGAVLGVFHWIDGELLQNDETRSAEYRILAKVYSVPVDGLPIRRQAYTAGPAELFFIQRSKMADGPFSRLLDSYQGPLERRGARLAQFAKRCGQFYDRFYITHGDAGGNILKNRDAFYLIDWDGASLAPPERDAWFYMHMDGETEKFNNELRNQGVSYTFRPERLAFSCYYAYFQYLTEYMETYFEKGAAGVDAASLREDFFEGWIEPIMKIADAMPL